ncbi:MAG: glutelin [Aquabacterium sp.]|uniref:glutelin n=1 Tax=Aquabacterium sp. TaxID=1872578 RepID=UPI003BE8E4C1
MNASRFSLLRRGAVGAFLALGAVVAHAGGVFWAVNVDAPLQGVGRVGTTVSNSRWGVVQQPGVVAYAPPPVVMYPQAVIMPPQPRVVYMPPPQVVTPLYGYPVPVVERPNWRHHHHHHHDDWDDGRRGWGR